MTAQWRPPFALVGAWLGLLALLGLTVGISYVRLGALNMPIALVIGATKMAIVAAIFMELRSRGPRTFVFATAGLFWLGILLWLGLMDFVTRS